MAVIFSLPTLLCCLFALTTYTNCAAIAEAAIYSLFRDHGVKAFDMIPTGTDLNQKILGFPLLILAAQGDFGEGVVEELLARGADPNIGSGTSSSISPLFMVIIRQGSNQSDTEVPRDLRVIKALLAAGAVPSALVSGLNTLHVVSNPCAHPAIFQHILQHSPELIESVSEGRSTPLDFCVAHNEVEKVRMLLKAGARPSVKREVFDRLSDDDRIRKMVERAREIWSECRNYLLALRHGPMIWQEIADPFITYILPRLTYNVRVSEEFDH